MDYYKILNLNIDSSKKEIISTYKEILNQYSPTAFEDQKIANQFKVIYKAYYILSDDFRRDNYNKFYLKNDFESEEFKTWHKNQFKKLREYKSNSDYSSVGEVIANEFIGGMIVEGISGIGEIIGSIFD